MNLQPNEVLWLEVSEDYAIISAAGEDAVQVKASRATSRPTRYSLQSVDVREAISRFWLRAAESPGARLTFIANGGVAVERDYNFPGEVGGLTYWGLAARGADLAPLRAALSELFVDAPIGHWLSSSPSDDDVRDKLLRRVTWALDASDINELNVHLRDQVGAIYIERGLPASAVSNGLRVLLDHIFEVASRSDPATRYLTVLHRHAAIEEAMNVLNLAKQMGMAEYHTAANSHSALVDEITSEYPNLVQRDETVATISASVGAEPLLWLHGTHGAGKSTLARLLANYYRGRWLVLDLRPVQRNPDGVLVAWSELLRAIAIHGMPSGIVLDDFDDAAVDALSGRLSALTKQLAERGSRVIVTAPKQASAGRLAALGASIRAIVAAPYFSQTEIKDLVSRAPAPEAKYVDAWALFIRLASGSGHPLLVVSKIASLRARNWPSSALMEDVGKVSEAIQVTREESRRALLRDLSVLDQARSLDAGELLRRIGVIFDRVDTGLATLLAKQEPAIGTAGDALAVLRGSWLELLPDDELRLSPVIADIGDDLDEKSVHRWRRVAAEYWLRKRVLNNRTLPLCFWNAFLGQHDWVLLKIFTTLQAQQYDVLRGALALLTPITTLRVDTSIYPSNSVIGVNLRLLQFQVVDSIETDSNGAEIAKRLLLELNEIENTDIRATMIAICAPMVLLAKKVYVSPGDRLTFALRLRQATPRVNELGGEEIKRANEGIMRGFDIDTDVAGVDVPGVLFANTISKTRNSDDFLSTVEALDALSDEDRRSFLNALSAVFGDLTVFVNSGWSRDQLGGRDMAITLGVYERATAIIEQWMNPGLAAEFAVARSVILDEGLGESERALGGVDAAISRFGHLPILVRQKAKVLGRNGHDSESADLIVSIEDTVGGASKLERSLALRDGGASAARSGHFEIAARLYGKAIDAIDGDGQQKAFAVGLRVDRAMTLWDGGERAAALICLADSFEMLETLKAAESRQNERAHQFARGVAGLFFHDTENYPVTPRPIIHYGNASALSLPNEALLNVDIKPLADNWRILALVEASFGLDVGIDARSRAKQVGLGAISIESMIGFARYGQSLVRSDLDETLVKGIRAVSGMRIAAATGSAGDVGRIGIEAIATIPLADMLADPQLRDAIIRISIDVLVARRLQGQWTSDLLDRLGESWSRIVGDESLIISVLKSATGRYAVGSSATFNVWVASLLAKQDDQIAASPNLRFRRDMVLVVHLSNSLACRVLEPLLVSALQSGWTDVIAKQSFLLRSPMQYCAAIEAALSELPVHGLRAAARLILAVGPSVDVVMPEDWASVLSKIANQRAL